MDHELWRLLRRGIRRADRRVCRELGVEKKVQFSSRLIVAMHCWQVHHDRPMSWACDRKHYGGVFRPRKLPSISQYTRRVKSARVQHLLQRLHEQVSGSGATAALSYFDGKLLPVAMHSKDVGATKVRTNAGYVRGYRLHAWGVEDGRIAVWSLTGAHEGEQTVARSLCQHLPVLPQGALILADIRFDSAKLYGDVAARGATLLTPLKAISQRKKHRQRMGPARCTAAQTWEQHPSLARLLLRQRSGIERIFGCLCSVAGGLAPLPAWVRTPARVRRWVGVKIILHNARCTWHPRVAA